MSSPSIADVVMEESGQTDAERRELRQKQRKLQHTIELNKEAMEDPSSSKFEEIRQENNQLFKKVYYTREAVLDGENVDMIAERAAHQVEGNIKVPRYDALRLSQKLRQKCSTRQGKFDWKAIGAEIGVCFRSVPSRVSFLCGPLEADYVPRERKRRARRTNEQDMSGVKAERPEYVQNQERNVDQLSAVERNIKVLSKTLRKRSRDAVEAAHAEIQALPEEEQEPARKRLKHTAPEVDAIRCLFNPESFTQTVENLFHFSFLVKDGQAKIGVRDNKPVVAHVPPQQDDNSNKPCRQAIVALTMQDWRKLCAAYHVEQSDTPHRTGTKQVKHIAMEANQANATETAAVKESPQDELFPSSTVDDSAPTESSLPCNLDELKIEAAEDAAVETSSQGERVRASTTEDSGASRPSASIKARAGRVLFITLFVQLVVQSLWFSLSHFTTHA